MPACPSRASSDLTRQIVEPPERLRGAQVDAHLLARLALGRFARLHEFLFQHLALRHVADHAGDERGLGRRHRAKADLDGKFAAVLAPADEFHADTHGPQFRILAEIPPVPGVRLANALGQQHFDRVAEHLLPVVAEHSLGLAVYDRDLAVIVVLLVWNSEPVLRRVGIDPDLVPLTMGYLRALVFGVPAMYAYLALRFMSEGIGWTRPIMMAAVVRSTPS